MTESAPATRRYDFAFAPSYRLAALAFGVMPSTAWVTLGPDGLRVRFGPWRLNAGLDNIDDAQLSGGFGWLKTAGPAHLSFADRGVTFATNGDAAVCLTFRTPVPGIDPTKRIRHPGATVTVEDPPALLDHLRSLQG
jgi:hypothetical protein